MIQSFACKETEKIWYQIRPKGLPFDILKRALMKLDMIDCARDINDLRTPPGNHLEALKGDRAGEHSIKINDQWRICFVWDNGNARNVKIEDYHK
ncbi:MAG: plasmid maintenance system killer [Verrucomicrobia bacterium CG_4_10_14_3_um_filter_43_23]|nr:MAG: plasmid maintenance system killer [Verrucomicrobia bacterium CG1_02_43_26]PIP58646.1 MAG: plasmid maintenance system killer [Verrucomicrobia bacterium CG22_combo_CG10-13_8_21_14_all_43_17]PIX58402.1 MAG: plasmid maintenance system killer [Verrucomicrobia bacterium CG_4_10_14_3_um_filter_43_23]PIY61240.1 MAG: plasmid maintenance system killer [Verrucomicrobia bacterium CG_4_10_14_0_8_um_filter_43_34]PJA44945.1 MAG: plasmid maintenance system killer [Verrucomicrobia bacterium CG_4_9_14_3_